MEEVAALEEAAVMAAVADLVHPSQLRAVDATEDKRHKTQRSSLVIGSTSGGY
jgi:hypothetical protein